MKRIFESTKHPGYRMNEHGVVLCPPAEKKKAAAIIGHFALVDVDDIFAPMTIKSDVQIEARSTGFKFHY